MTTPLSLKEAWESFEKAVLADATDEQKRRISVYFHAGFYACFMTCEAISSMSEDEGCRAFSAIHEELEEWKNNPTRKEAE